MSVNHLLSFKKKTNKGNSICHILNFATICYACANTVDLISKTKELLIKFIFSCSWIHVCFSQMFHRPPHGIVVLFQSLLNLNR